MDENTIKAQLKVTISHHPTILCNERYNKLNVGVCVTMSK